MVAVANSCGLDVPSDGLSFPPCGVDDLAHILRPRDSVDNWKVMVWLKPYLLSNGTADRFSGFKGVYVVLGPRMNMQLIVSNNTG